jgi:phage-related tail protein
LDWGSFTKQWKRFNQQHPQTKLKDLGDFARMILQNKDKFSKKTEQRARFYKNVLEPKKKISGKSIAMPKKLTKKQLKAIEEEMKGEGLYVGSGIYSGQGFMAGSGCPQCGMMEGGAVEISHPILDEISGGNIFGDAGRWFKKAGRTINKAVIKPTVKWTKKAVKDVDRSVVKPIGLAFGKDQALDKAFSKGGVMEKAGRTIFREGVPVLTGALAGAAGALATGGVGGLAAGYAGGKAGDELVKMSGVGVKKGGARKGQPAGARLAYDDVPKRRGRFAKGSQEAKDFMAELRSRRKSKN